MSKSVIARCTLLLLAAVLLVNLAVPAGASGPDSVREAIVSSHENQLESVDLSGYQVTPDELKDIFYELKYGGQLPWYAKWYSYALDTETGFVTTYCPQNLDETEYDRDLYEQTVAQILAAAVHPGMSQWQIALSIHDYLVANSCYDETLTYRTGYDLLVRGTAVCAGYAEAYMDLMNRAGISCVKVISDPMEHSWNLVNIGGSWYHVDVTWDDPTSDANGLVVHDYFLISDQKISDGDHEHYGWETDILCDDISLDEDRFWHGITSQICYLSSDTSYVRYLDRDNRQYRIYLRDENTGDLTLLDTLKMEWLNLGSGSYWYDNNGLTLWNDRLYYSDMEYVYSTDTGGGDKRKEFYYDAEKHGKYIRGSFVRDGSIYMTLSTHGGDLEKVRYQMEDVYFHEHYYSEDPTYATCTSQGYSTFTCRCGVSYVGSYTPVRDHVFDESFTLKGFIDDIFGVRHYACFYCGATVTADLIFPKEEAQTLPDGSEATPQQPKGLVPKALAWLADAWERNPVMTIIQVGVVLWILRWLFSPATPKQNQ